MSSTPKLYTLDEVAEMMKVSKSTVIYWIRTGKLDRVKIGRLVRIEPEALKRFMKAQQTKPKKGENMNEPQILTNEDGSPRLMGTGHYVAAMRGTLTEETRLAYTTQPGLYAIIKDGKPTGLFLNTLEGR